MNFTLKSASFKKDFESNDTKRHRLWKGFLKKDPTGHSEQDTRAIERMVGQDDQGEEMVEKWFLTDLKNHFFCIF